MFQATSISRPPGERYSAEDLGQVLLGDLLLEKAEPPGSPGLEICGFVLEVDDGDIFKRDVDVPQQDREHAFADCAIPDDQYLVLKIHHTPPQTCHGLHWYVRREM